MKKVFSVVSLVTVLAVGGGLLNRHSSHKQVAADAPTSGTISTDLATMYDDCASTPDGSYMKLLPNPQTAPVYISETETNLFSAVINKGSAGENAKIRNYNGKNENYYLYLKYSSLKTAGSLGSEIVFSATGNYSFESISSTYIYRGYDNIAIYYSLDGTSWTKTSYAAPANAQPLSYTLPTAAPYVKLAHCFVTSEWIAIKDISLTFADSSANVITFDSQGGTSVESQYVSPNDYATQPTDPTKANVGSTYYTFAGWYTDPVNGDLFDFANTPITGDITLYAHWNEEVLSSYTLTFDTQGGSSIEPCVVPTDGTKFTKPSTNPTYPSDSLYNYTFHNWYTTPACTTKFNFDAVPTGDATAYAGYSKQSFAPVGYVTIDPKKDIGTWGSELTSFQAIDINTRETLDTKNYYTEMRWVVSPLSENGGMKNNGNFVINNATMSMTITNPTRYFAGFRIEFSVLTYSSSTVKTITLSTGGVTCDSGTSPCDSLMNSNLALTGDCSSKPQEFTFSFGNVGTYGVRFRYLYVQFGTYTTEEMAINYATQFNDANVCGILPTDGLNETKWGEQETAYNALPSEVRSYLTNYEGSNSEILECLERYDRVVSKHGSSYDFMGRIAAGKVSLAPIPTIASTINNNMTLVIVVLASVIAVAVIGGYFFYKRKQD